MQRSIGSRGGTDILLVSSIPVGRWRKVQGEFKMQAHRRSSVVMDIAAFKVSHCIGSDIDATSLQAEKARSASMGLWRNYHRRFEMQTLTSPSVSLG